MFRFFRVSALIICSLVASAANAQMPRMDLFAGFFRVEVEVAANQDDRMQGLMARKTLAAQQGMLFVFPQLATHCMWMKNTLIPLSVAFLDARGVILNIEDMHPQTLTNHCAAEPARYALEMNLGWFAKKGIQPGQTIRGLEKAPRPQ